MPSLRGEEEAATENNGFWLTFKRIAPVNGKDANAPQERPV